MRTGITHLPAQHHLVKDTWCNCDGLESSTLRSRFSIWILLSGGSLPHSKICHHHHLVNPTYLLYLEQEELLLDPLLENTTLLVEDEIFGSSLGAGGTTSGSSGGATSVSFFLCWRNNFWILSLAKNILGNILLGPKFKCPGMTRAGTSRKTTNNSKFIIV